MQIDLPCYQIIMPAAVPVHRQKQRTCSAPRYNTVSCGDSKKEKLCHNFRQMRLCFFCHYFLDHMPFYQPGVPP